MRAGLKRGKTKLVNNTSPIPGIKKAVKSVGKGVVDFIKAIPSKRGHGALKRK